MPIQLRGVRENNLKSIDLDIQRGQWLSICGVSGSGKSSLAMETLYAEGQRRYMESLAPSARQFLQQLDRPDADEIRGIPPSICVQRPAANVGLRTTVGSVTETVFYLRSLFSKLATPWCPACDRPVRSDDATSTIKWVRELGDGKLMIAFPVDLNDQFSETASQLKSEGLQRIVFDGKTSDLNEVERDFEFEQRGYVVVDRLTTASPVDRLEESLETAMQFGARQASLFLEVETERFATPVTVDDRNWFRLDVHGGSDCPNCGFQFPELESRLFSYTNPLGVCPECEGTGVVDDWDRDKIVPDDEFSLANHAILPWASPAGEIPSKTKQIEALESCCAKHNIDMTLPFHQLEPTQQEVLFGGDGEAFEGVMADLERQRGSAKSRKQLDRLERFRSPRTCSGCRGQRLNQAAQSFRMEGESIGNLCGMSVFELQKWLTSHQSRICQHRALQPVYLQIERRLEFLVEIGLPYLTLNRSIRTLSRGESQRVTLTSSLSSTLVNMLYVLDEPSIGLHPGDVVQLTNSICRLRDRGNTLVVVDHQEQVIVSADRVLEIGEGAGDKGGEIVFDGSAKELITPGASLTGEYLAGRRGISTNSANRRTPRGQIRLTGASGNNLKQLDIDFPLGVLCMVTGPSGSGKSSLVRQTLVPALYKRKKIESDIPLTYTHLSGYNQVQDVVLIDHSPIGRTGRSNPVTYVKAFDEIRKAFAETTDAKTNNLKASHFSFNVEGGRCDKCKGSGELSVDMQFLSDVYMTCDLCSGRRYREEVLKAKYRGKTIHDVLSMSAAEAFPFFRGHPKVQAKLKSLMDVGLGYIRLGQPATKLSGGEAQRLKLAHHLNSPRQRSLFVFEEPTTGLHMADVVKLTDCLDALLAVGHSMIIIEHNMNLVKFADWIIDLGPGAGEEGGHVVAMGTPEQIVGNPNSLTGKHLRSYLEREQE